MIFFHQYGARRTGTNYALILLKENFLNISVLSTIAWKHGSIKTPEEYKRAIFPNFPFLHKIQIEELDVAASNYTKEQTDLLAKDLAAAARNEEIHNLVMIKNPYAWIDSVWRYSINTHENTHNDLYMFFDHKKSLRLRDHEAAVISSIKSYNLRYKKWLTNATEIIRYEDLLQNYQGILQYFKIKYNLTQRHERLIDIKDGCDPNPIIHEKILPDWSYSNYYLNHNYMDNLPPNIIQNITDTVDWELFEEYDYQPI